MRKIYKLIFRNRVPVMLVILVSFITLHSFAQSPRISGIVKDEKGGTIPGVTVLLKGTSTAVSTDKEGKFIISAPLNGTLLFRFVGFTNKEVAINGRNNLMISLQPESSNLSEVVVTGVFDKRKAINASIAISSLSATQITKQAPVSAADLLKNIPGVYVNSSLGEIRNTVYSRGVSVGSNDGA